MDKISSFRITIHGKDENYLNFDAVLWIEKDGIPHHVVGEGESLNKAMENAIKKIHCKDSSNNLTENAKELCDKIRAK